MLLFPLSAHSNSSQIITLAWRIVSGQVLVQKSAMEIVHAADMDKIQFLQHPQMSTVLLLLNEATKSCRGGR